MPREMNLANRKVIDPEFAKRFVEACDNSLHCPELNAGRLAWIVSQFKRQFDIKVSVQSVSRWYIGETKPRKEKCDALAKLLGTDAVWLYWGEKQQPMKARRNNKAADAMADAAASLLEVHEAMGKGDSHAAKTLREAIANYREAA